MGLSVSATSLCYLINVQCFIQGGPIKTGHFLRYHIFAATTDIGLIMRFLLKCSEITAEKNLLLFYGQHFDF